MDYLATDVGRGNLTTVIGRLIEFQQQPVDRRVSAANPVPTIQAAPMIRNQSLRDIESSRSFNIGCTLLTLSLTSSSYYFEVCAQV